MLEFLLRSYEPKVCLLPAGLVCFATESARLVTLGGKIHYL